MPGRAIKMARLKRLRPRATRRAWILFVLRVFVHGGNLFGSAGTQLRITKYQNGRPACASMFGGLALMATPQAGAAGRPQLTAPTPPRAAKRHRDDPRRCTCGAAPLARNPHAQCRLLSSRQRMQTPRRGPACSNLEGGAPLPAGGQRRPTPAGCTRMSQVHAAAHTHRRI